VLMATPNRALEPTAACGLRRLAVLSSLRSSPVASRERWAAHAEGQTTHTSTRREVSL